MIRDYDHQDFLHIKMTIKNMIDKYKNTIARISAALMFTTFAIVFVKNNVAFRGVDIQQFNLNLFSLYMYLPLFALSMLWEKKDIHIFAGIRSGAAIAGCALVIGKKAVYMSLLLFGAYLLGELLIYFFDKKRSVKATFIKKVSKFLLFFILSLPLSYAFKYHIHGDFLDDYVFSQDKGFPIPEGFDRNKGFQDYRSSDPAETKSTP